MVIFLALLPEIPTNYYFLSVTMLFKTNVVGTIQSLSSLTLYFIYTSHDYVLQPDPNINLAGKMITKDLSH